MDEARFGPAGNSESFAAEGYKKSEDAPAWLAAKGLTAFEYQCGRGVRCGEETARKIGEAAREHGIRMSIHAPYFINLSSEETERMEKNVGYVMETAQLAVPLGATRMVVHCGGQGKLTRERAMRNTHENVKNILRAMDTMRSSSMRAHTRITAMRFVMRSQRCACPAWRCTCPTCMRVRSSGTSRLSDRYVRA